MHVTVLAKARAFRVPVLQGWNPSPVVTKNFSLFRTTDLLYSMIVVMHLVNAAQVI